MDLLQVRWKPLRHQMPKTLFLVSTLLLAACVSVTNQSAEELPTNTEQHITIKPSKAEVATLPLNSELVYYILMAEIAGQRGQIGVAADLYDKAANSIDSPALAGRSTQIANFTRNEKRITRALERWKQVDPEDADIYLMQAPFLMLEGDYEGVVKAVDKALALAPNKSQLYLTQVADNLSELADSEQALNVIKRLQLYQHQHPEALFVSARLAAFFKQYEKALPDVEALLKQQPHREDGIILKAEILQRLGESDRALALLKKAIKKGKPSDSLRFSYAKLLGENNKTSQARQIFEALNVDNPQNKEVIFALGLLALEQKDGDEAKHYFNQLIKLGDPGKQASYFMGLAEELNDHLDAALVWFASVPADSPRFQAAQSRYIHLLADNNQLDKARLHLQLLRKENPDRALQYFLFEAAFLREKNLFQEALELYGEALSAYPNDVELLYGRAMTAESLNDLDFMESDLKKILVIDPNNASALNALGYTLADRTDRYQEALQLIEKALVISPDDPFYLDSLGWVHYRLGHLDLAIRYLKQAIAIQNDPEFLAHLGEVLWHQDKQSEAKKVWQEGLTSDPNNALIKDTMQRLGL